MMDLDHIQLPDGTKAVLWDMDGVLVDSLQLDFAVCAPLLEKFAGKKVTLSREIIRTGFHLSADDFLPFLASKAGVMLEPGDMQAAHQEYDARRAREVYPLTPNIREVLSRVQAAGLTQIVVSNNPTALIEDTLERCGLRAFFAGVVGNDIPGLKKKPAPDPYLKGIELAGVDPSACVVVEDTVPGTQAGRAAGCFVIGVATGGAEIRQLEQADSVDVAYLQFAPPKLSMTLGNVRDKTILSPNDFVSHMVEHIAWRLGAAIDMAWPNTDWRALGRTCGEVIAALPARERRSAALGMIDNGSAEVMIDLDAAPAFRFDAMAGIDREWFLASRCEQIPDGRPLIELGEGLAEGMGAAIHVRLATFEDAHHSWEGVYRAIGIALSRIYRPAQDPALPDDGAAAAPSASGYAQGDGRLETVSVSLNQAEVARLTAESETRVRVMISDTPAVKSTIEVGPSIHVDGLPTLLTAICDTAGLEIDLTFRATRLSSSHVVLEDTGIVLGKALLEILVHRMEQVGVNGAGSSLHTRDGFNDEAPQVGISVEGRKFFHIACFDEAAQDVRRALLFNHTVLGGLRSEDLDDFLDGLCVGMSCSLMLHLRRFHDPESDWRAIAAQLGVALKECFAVNPARKGLPPGVKATLA